MITAMLQSLAPLRTTCGCINCPVPRIECSRPAWGRHLALGLVCRRSRPGTRDCSGRPPRHLVRQQSVERPPSDRFSHWGWWTLWYLESSVSMQTWNLSKDLQDRRFQGKKFTQKTRNFRHLLNRDKKCVNALNWDKTSKKSLFYQFILAQHQ